MPKGWVSGLSANRGGVERKDTGLIQQVDRKAKHDHSQRAIGGHDRDSRSWRRRKLGRSGSVRFWAAAGNSRKKAAIAPVIEKREHVIRTSFIGTTPRTSSLLHRSHGECTSKMRAGYTPTCETAYN